MATIGQLIMGVQKLTPEQKAWFIGNYANTRNQELADRLGVSSRYVTRMARELGLWKSREFMAAMQRNAAEHAARANRMTGGNAGAANLLIHGKNTRFRKGESQKDRMTPEAFSDMCRRRGETRKGIFRAERRRVLFGLEQKTRLRVVAVPWRKKKYQESAQETWVPGSEGFK